MMFNRNYQLQESITPAVQMSIRNEDDDSSSSSESDDDMIEEEEEEEKPKTHSMDVDEDGWTTVHRRTGGKKRKLKQNLVFIVIR